MYRTNRFWAKKLTNWQQYPWKVHLNKVDSHRNHIRTRTRDHTFESRRVSHKHTHTTQTWANSLQHTAPHRYTSTSHASSHHCSHSLTHSLFNYCRFHDELNAVDNDDDIFASLWDIKTTPLMPLHWCWAGAAISFSLRSINRFHPHMAWPTI